MSDPARLAPGEVLGGDFRIVSPLGAGGMGAVYVADQLSTGKRRALKVMLPALVTDPKSHGRFVAEAQAGARIDSDHVVEVIAAGVDAAKGVPWIAMELLEGDELDGHVRKHGPLAWEQVLDLLDQLAHALGQAHRLGIIHRDLKPENLFLARAKRRGGAPVLKILDFGIASFTAERGAATVTTAIGSPFWIAPEQAATGAILRPSTDVWAIGLIAFFLLTGKWYWPAANADNVNLNALLAEILAHPLVPASQRARELGAGVELPAGFDAWFARCVARDPEARYADANAAVEPLLAGAVHERSVAPTAPIDAAARERSHVEDAPQEAPHEAYDPSHIDVPQKAPLDATRDRAQVVDRPQSPPIAPTLPLTAKPERRRSPVPARVLWLGLGGVALASLIGITAFALWPSEDLELSEPTLRTIAGLEDELTITAYFSRDLPAPFDETAPRARALLAAYERAGAGRVVVRFVDPRNARERAQAEHDGILPVAHRIVADAATPDDATGYRGIAIRYLGDTQTIPIVTTTRGLEHQITRTIRELLRPTRIAHVAGHGGPEVHGLSLAASVEPVELSAPIPRELDALLIVEPTERFSPEELRRIDDYVAGGGSLGVFGGALEVRLEQRVSARPIDTGLTPLLSAWGVALRGAIVADTDCGRVPMRHAIGLMVPVAYPPAPTIRFYGPARGHPIVGELESATLFFVSPLTTHSRLRELGGQVLAESSEESWLITDPSIDLAPRAAEQWQPEDPSGPFTLMVALDRVPRAFSGAASSGGSGRVIVMGTGSLLRTEFAPRDGEEPPAQALARRALEWLVEDRDLAAIRDRDVPSD